jgi:hypothetical protein
LEEPGLEGRIILSGHTAIVLQGVEWIDVAQHRKKKGAVVNTAMNFRVL